MIINIKTRLFLCIIFFYAIWSIFLSSENYGNYIALLSEKRAFIVTYFLSIYMFIKIISYYYCKKIFKYYKFLLSHL